MEDMHRIMAFLRIKQGSYENIAVNIKEASYEAVSDGFCIPLLQRGKRVCCGESLEF